MGSCCCIQKSLKVSPTDFASSLPDGIVNIVEESDPKRINEFADLVSESFCGTTTTPPEPIMAWTYDHGDGTFELDAGTASGEILKKVPSLERTEYFRFIGHFITHQCLRHGGCYALEDTDGKLCAAAITIPPNANAVWDIGLCEMMMIIEKMGGDSKIPERMNKGISKDKMDQVEKIMQIAHKNHAPSKHLYLYVLATKPEVQGKGYGSKLLKFINNAATFQHVPAYLETSGKKNEEFYLSRGWIVAGRYPLSVKGYKLKADADDTEGNLLAMTKPVY